MSRSWRRISFPRRSRFSSAAMSSCAVPPGSSSSRSRLRPIQRTSSDNPTTRSSAISRWVPPIVRTRRTASSSNSFIDRRCCFMEVLLRHRDFSTFPKQVQLPVGARSVLSPVTERYLLAGWRPPEAASGLACGDLRRGQRPPEGMLQRSRPMLEPNPKHLCCSANNASRNGPLHYDRQARQPNLLLDDRPQEASTSCNQREC
jgi:hypothetical protein